MCANQHNQLKNNKLKFLIDLKIAWEDDEFGRGYICAQF